MALPTVRDIMNTKVIAAHPEMTAVEAHELITKNAIDGVPVVDDQNILVGILTEYDMIAKGSSLHLPTFQQMLTELKVDQSGGQLEQDATALAKMKVRDLMNSDPLSMPDTSSFEEVVTTFRDHHRVNPIPVVDQDKKVVGVVTRCDVLKLFTLLKPKI